MKKLFLLFLAILLAISFQNCSQKKSDSRNLYKSESISYDKDSSNEEKVKKSDDNIKTENKNIERKIIKNGTINIDIKDIQNIEKIIEEEIKKVNGYIASSSIYKTYGTIVLKIPAEKFEEFINIVPNFGKITYKTINAEDVTKKYYDLEKRIETKKILQQRYQNYLKNATKVEDLLNIERELNNVTAEIESLELEFKNLIHLISYSTLTLNLYMPGSSEVTRYLPSLKNGFLDFGYAFLNFLYIIFFVLLYGIIFGIPLILLVALIYFITFGKIGLIKKLFKKLSEK